MPYQASTAIAQNYSKFRSLPKALSAIQQHRQNLIQAAKPNDQAHDDGILHLLPPQVKTNNPIIMLGGMGPLAGLEGFEQACCHWGQQREIILYQACHIPSRTQAILTQYAGNPLPAEHLSQTLAQAIIHASEYCPTATTLHLLLLCNTAHFFLPRALNFIQQQNPTLFSRLHIVSMLNAGVQEAAALQPRCVVPLTTTGTWQAGLYHQALAQAQIATWQLPKTLQQLLQHAIYDGVKAAQPQATLHWGSTFFRQLQKQAPNTDVLLAGCTEVTTLISQLEQQAAPSIQKLIQQTQVINPLPRAIAQL